MDSADRNPSLHSGGYIPRPDKPLRLDDGCVWPHSIARLWSDRDIPADKPGPDIASSQLSDGESQDNKEDT